MDDRSGRVDKNVWLEIYWLQTSVRVGSSAAQVLKIRENEMRGFMCLWLLTIAWAATVVLQTMCLSRIWQISRVSSTVDNARYRPVYPGKWVFG